MRAVLRVFVLSLTFVGSSVAFPALVLSKEKDSVPGAAGCPFAAARQSQAGGKRQLVTFDPVKQKIDVSGKHAFQPPGPGDQRVAALVQALANHNFISHNGITTLLEATTASNKIFGFGIDLAAAAAACGVIFGGNPVTQVFSIGGPPPGLVIPPLISRPPGLSGTHNRFEGDASPTRGDAYTHNGDPSLLDLDSFRHLYDLVQEGSSGNFDTSVLTDHRAWTRQNDWIVGYRNPHFFVSPLGTLILSTLTHMLIPRCFSNHSEEFPAGYLNHDNLKSFFAVSGDRQNFVYQQGYEKIPDNWYRRPDDYTIPLLLADFVAMSLKYPEFLSLGGNTGQVNSFAGLDLGDLTGGVFNSANLLQGKNLVCFVFQAVQGGIPGVLDGVASTALGILNLGIFNDNIKPLLADCPALSQYNVAAFQAYPGASGAV
ncbi:Aromatic peroxygenase [Ceratobasidium theobromae]|uniref:Aromatic peroxygenase n=1 Tax=Ceratobasidium theobromae TaxID=1582974 RepID=A0A5N5QIC2_9AGAM|nr:Aromatic peroxygenase [Ceratobasidium theobromae]